MDRYNIQQRVEIVKIYYKNSCSVRQTFRELRNIYGRNDRPTERSIQRIIAKFEQSGSVADRAVPVRRRNVRSSENIAAVAESVAEDPNLSIPRRAQGGERYRAMITDFLWPQLDDMDLDDMWFQQDGATCHTSGFTLELLQEKFPERVICRRGDVEWPPRSCDLTPLDFFLWGYVKSLVYGNKPTTIDQLENNIIQTIGEIQPDLCNRVIQNWTSRIESCKRSRGGHLNDIIFKT